MPSSPDDDRALLDRLSKAAVRIETVAGRPLEDLASYDWRDTTRPDVAAACVQAEGATVDPQILDEVHHRQYGRPWALGKYLFDFLVERGLRPGDRLLDIGCGALRLGLPAIAYLDRGTYFGVDAHLKSLEAAVTYELPLHGLEHKQPRLLWDDELAFAHFQTEFDWAVDFATSLHLPKDAAATLFRNAAAVAPSGRAAARRERPGLEAPIVWAGPRRARTGAGARAGPAVPPAHRPPRRLGEPVVRVRARRALAQPSSRSIVYSGRPETSRWIRPRYSPTSARMNPWTPRTNRIATPPNSGPGKFERSIQ